jgi:hypothetical protein
MSVWQDLPLVILNPGSDPEPVRATKTFTEPVPERQFIRLRFVK